MTDKLRAAAQQALEAMEQAHDESLDENHFECRQVLMGQITALRAALAEQPAKQSAKHGEPVRTEFTRVINHAIEQGTEAWVFLRCWQEGDWSGCAEFGFEPNMAAYTAPQPAKQPLTDEEIAALWLDSISGPLTATKFARAVIAAYERKNGINVPQARGEQE